MRHDEIKIAIMSMVNADPQLGLSIRRALIVGVIEPKQRFHLNEFMSQLLKLERSLLEQWQKDEVSICRVKCLQFFDEYAAKYP